MAHQFEPDVIAAICNYMNDASMRANLTEIVKALSSDDDITEATMIRFDGDGFDVDIAKNGDTSVARFPWSRPVTQRGEVREQLLLLFERAAFG
jgi:hypothetical protein